jgi:hypothetical protein
MLAAMRARVPLDVDLEDRLAYGLTPGRFACLAVGVLAGIGCWSALPATDALRLGLAWLLVLVGAGVAWGRWRGRSFDAWAVDIVRFVGRNYRVRFNRPRFSLRSSAVGDARVARRRSSHTLVAAVVLFPLRPVRHVCGSAAGALRWLVEPQSP